MPMIKKKNGLKAFTLFDCRQHDLFFKQRDQEKALTEIERNLTMLKEEKKILQWRYQYGREHLEQKEAQMRSCVRETLYERVKQETGHSVKLLEKCLRFLAETSDPVEEQRLLSEINVIGICLKRLIYLTLLQAKDDQIRVKSLRLCFDEVFRGLEARAVVCAFSGCDEAVLMLTEAIEIYRFLGQIIERTLTDLTALLITLHQEEGCLRFSMSVESDQDLFKSIEPYTMQCERDVDGTWLFSKIIEEEIL